MRAVRLVAVSDEYDSHPGLILKGVQMTDGMMGERGDGTMIAHDLLEHLNGVQNIGTVWDELEALGAIWQLRGRHGDLGRETIHSPAFNVASDASRMFFDWVRDSDTRGTPLRKTPTRTDYEDDFAEIVDLTRSQVLEEARYQEDVKLDRLDEYLTEVRDRMRIGFRKAWRKYGGGWRGPNYFQQVREAAARAAKMVDYEGQEFILRYCQYDNDVRPADYSAEWL